jgi:glycosyltransferase involved in cell wall biosynthesis
LTTDSFNRTIGLQAGKIRTLYFVTGRKFQPVRDEDMLGRVKRQYGLPKRFIFTLSGFDRGQRKNVDGILQAYRIYYEAVLSNGDRPRKLVVGGKGCEQFRTDYAIPGDGYGRDILFPGWIDQADLPAVYSLADLYLYPSFSEAFPIPITEALACGTPIVTSNLNGLKEIAGDAALLVDARDPAAIAEAMGRALTEPDLRDTLVARGLARSRLFSWETCARQTLEILEQVARAAG